MATTIDWPADSEWTFSPSDDDLEHERRYWRDLDRIADHDAWVEMQAELESFESWPLDDLLDELETVRTLTPDQTDIIEELTDEIDRRTCACGAPAETTVLLVASVDHDFGTYRSEVEERVCERCACELCRNGDAVEGAA